MAKASDNVFPKIILGVGSAPAAPADSSWRLYSQANGIYAKSSNTTVGPLGTGGAGTSVATDVIWDAAGDLVYGTGADTATRLAVGSNGTHLKSTGSAPAWALPPGAEIDYKEYLGGDLTISGANEGAATSIITSNAVTYDGSTSIMIEFFGGRCTPGAAAGSTMVFILLEDSTVLGRLGLLASTSTTSATSPITLRRRRTPSNASHTYTVKAWMTSGAGTVTGNNGGSGVELPIYLRITKV